MEQINIRTDETEPRRGELARELRGDGNGLINPSPACRWLYGHRANRAGSFGCSEHERTILMLIPPRTFPIPIAAARCLSGPRNLHTYTY
jgi:hypothetical protein